MNYVWTVLLLYRAATSVGKNNVKFEKELWDQIHYCENKDRFTCFGQIWPLQHMSSQSPNTKQIFILWATALINRSYSRSEDGAVQYLERYPEGKRKREC